MQKLIGLVIASIVMLVIVTVVVIPVLQEGDYDTTVKGANEPTYYFKPVSDGAITIADGKWTQNGTDTAISGNILMISDSLAIQYSSGNAVLFDYAGEHYGKISDLTIGGSGTTYTATLGGSTVTGSLGANPVIVSDSSTGATVGRFANKSFFVDQDENVRTWRTLNVTDSGSNSLATRTLTVGPVDDTNAYSVAYVNSAYVGVTSAAAELNANSYTTPDSLVYKMTSDPTMDYTIVYDSATYTATESVATSMFAPLEYDKLLDSGESIKSMIDLVPLLMVVGVILMIVTAIIIRK